MKPRWTLPTVRLVAVAVSRLVRLSSFCWERMLALRFRKAARVKVTSVKLPHRKIEKRSHMLVALRLESQIIKALKKLQDALQPVTGPGHAKVSAVEVEFPHPAQLGQSLENVTHDLIHLGGIAHPCASIGRRGWQHDMRVWVKNSLPNVRCAPTGAIERKMKKNLKSLWPVGASRLVRLFLFDFDF